MKILACVFLASLSLQAIPPVPVGMFAGKAPAAEAAAFTPSNITSLVAFYESENNQNDGTYATNWLDRLGTYNLTNLVTAATPTLVTDVVNGQPSIRWSAGANLYLAGTLPADTKPCTIACVVRSDDYNANRTIIGGAEGNGALSLDVYQYKFRLLKQGLAAIGSSTTSYTNSTWYIVIVTYDTDGSYAFYVNGSEDGTGTSDQTLTSRTTRVGSDFNASPAASWDKDMVALIKCNAKISSSDRQSLEHFWATKYGITISH
jgi:hypothetical protein